MIFYIEAAMAAKKKIILPKRVCAGA